MPNPVSRLSLTRRVSEKAGWLSLTRLRLLNSPAETGSPTAEFRVIGLRGAAEPVVDGATAKLFPRSIDLPNAGGLQHGSVKKRRLDLATGKSA